QRAGSRAKIRAKQRHGNLSGEKRQHQRQRQADKQGKKGQLLDDKAERFALFRRMVARHHRVGGDQHRRVQQFNNAKNDDKSGGQVAGLSRADQAGGHQFVGVLIGQRQKGGNRQRR